MLHQGVPRAICCFAIDDVIVDPGPESAHRALLEGLDGFVPRAILLTHIHFDHAGATGALCRLWPDAEVWVHERGARHMIDPSRLVASVLFGVQPGDPSTIAAALLLMIAIAGVATYAPARRAARLDPTQALRCE